MSQSAAFASARLASMICECRADIATFERLTSEARACGNLDRADYLSETLSVLRDELASLGAAEREASFRFVPAA